MCICDFIFCFYHLKFSLLRLLKQTLPHAPTYHPEPKAKDLAQGGSDAGAGAGDPSAAPQDDSGGAVQVLVHEILRLRLRMTAWESRWGALTFPQWGKVARQSRAG